MKWKWMILVLLWIKMKWQQLANDNNPINFNGLNQVLLYISLICEAAELR